MSDRETENGQNTRLLRALVWAGVGLAPIAALVVLVGATRFGVLLIAVCVVLLGATLLIRNDPVLLGMDVEDHVADRINALRDQLRGEIAAASARVAAPPAVVPTFPAREPTVPMRDAAIPAREPGRAVAAVRPEPGVSTGGRVAGSARPIVPPPPDPGYARQPADGRAVVAASPGSGSVVPAPVPGQRARAAASVPPPMAPVFRPPMPPAARTYGAAPEPEQGGRRRADVTAVDLGYTGRRSRPDDDGDGYPPATGGYDDGGYGGGYGDPDPGHPGWAEADDRYGEPVADPLNAQYDWRGRERTGGW